MLGGEELNPIKIPAGKRNNDIEECIISWRWEKYGEIYCIVTWYQCQREK